MSDVSKTNELIAEATAHIDNTLAGIGTDESSVRAAWARGEGSDDRFSLLVRLRDRLADALESVRAERDAALARIAEAAKLHRKYTYYDLEDSCPDTTDEHREEHHHEASDDIGEFYCDQMPTGDVACDNCRDVNGDRMEWPCPTIQALEGAPEPEEEL